MGDKLTFTVFADLHYKKGMYVSSVDDVLEIFDEAEKKGSSLVVHLGDMCNDYLRSVEITNAYLNNSKGLDVCGVYGNHELETVGNDMALVTPLLTNKTDDAVWGSDDGKIGDGSIAYYYYDKGSFRFVCTDTNYSLDPVSGNYVHNLPASWGPPDENTLVNSLGPKQLKWLESVLTDAAEKEKTCIILSHAAFYTEWDPAADADKVRAIFDKVNSIRKNTVVLSLNGHYHNNRSAVLNDVTYLDINTVHSGWWDGKRFYPYAEKDMNAPIYTYRYTEYDQGGNPAESFNRPLSSLTMGAQTLFLKDPLFTTVTVGSDGAVEMLGKETEWMYGITPKDPTVADNLRRISEFKK